MLSDEDVNIFTESMIVDGRHSRHSTCILFIDRSVDGIKKNDYKACILVSKDKENFCIEVVVLVQGSDKKLFDGGLRSLPKITITLSFERTVKVTVFKNILCKIWIDLQVVPMFEIGRITFDYAFRKSKKGKILIDQLLCFAKYQSL